ARCYLFAILVQQPFRAVCLTFYPLCCSSLSAAVDLAPVPIDYFCLALRLARFRFSLIELDRVVAGCVVDFYPLVTPLHNMPLSVSHGQSGYLAAGSLELSDLTI